MKLFDKPAVYFIMGTENAKQRNPLEILEMALAGGISLFQLREKGPFALEGEALKEFAAECKKLCLQYSVPFIINDDVELACGLDADGVHVGQEDTSATAVRARLGKGKLVGVSVHSTAEARLAVERGADYVGMGPVFGTRSKTDAKSPAGVGGIEAVKSMYPNLPVIGIGGIEADNSEAVWRAGADGVAVISAITDAEDAAQQIDDLKAAYKMGVLE